MSGRHCTILGIISLCIVHETKPELHTEVVTIDAAYSFEFRSKVYLLMFVGDKVQILVDHEGSEISDREYVPAPSSTQLQVIQAAYTRRNNAWNRTYYGDKYGINVYESMNMKKFKYGKNRNFLKNGGPDAVGKRVGVVYFFKGCEMVVRKTLTNWGKVQDVRSVGLPCDIDAAWAEQDRMVILKADEYYNWEADNTVNGPHKFHDNYTLIDWELTPAAT